MKRQITFAIGAILLLTTAVYAQDGGPPPPGGMVGRGPFGPGGFGPGGRAKVVTGAPYSADVNNQRTQLFPDGNSISQTTTGHVARDSQGRTYAQETITGGPFASNGPVTVTFISDPVAGYVYNLNSSTKTATRHALRTPPANAGRDMPGRGANRPAPPDGANIVTNDLGTQTVNGVNAQGKSVSHTIPAGAIGNAQPIVMTNETWYSPDLQLPVLAKRSDPRMGQSTYALTNIQRAEPPASLFQVPSDYTVQDGPARGGPGNRSGHGRPAPPQVQ